MEKESKNVGLEKEDALNQVRWKVGFLIFKFLQKTEFELLKNNQLLKKIVCLFFHYIITIFTCAGRQ